MAASRAALLAEQLRLKEKLAIQRARTHFLSFIKYTMPTYDVSWFHRVLAGALQRIADGECKRLIVTCPPRHGKTQQISIHFPAFMLGINPKAQIIAASYNATLASKMNRAVQRVMDSPEYACVFPGTRLNRANVRSAAGSWLRNNDEFEVVGHGGLYRSTGVGGSATGYGMTLGLIDDPVRNRQDANSPAYQEKVWDWWRSVFFTRLEKDGAVCIVLTRWSPADLVGKLLEQAESDPNADQWEVLNLPAIADDVRHPDDPREPGEALWPEKYSVERLQRMRASIGEYEWASLYQQTPAPRLGLIVRQEWWKFYERLPEPMDHWAISADLSFKDRGDPSAFQVWAIKGAEKYLVDQVHGRMTFTEQIRAFRGLCAKYPQATLKLVEEAANGAALIDTLRKEIAGIVAVRPVGSKGLRLDAVSPQIEAGNVYLPAVRLAPWINQFIAEFNVFPMGAHDDQIDAATQFLARAAQAKPKRGIRAFSSEPVKKRTIFDAI